MFTREQCADFVKGLGDLVDWSRNGLALFPKDKSPLYRRAVKNGALVVPDDGTAISIIPLAAFASVGVHHSGNDALVMVGNVVYTIPVVVRRPARARLH